MFYCLLYNLHLFRLLFKLVLQNCIRRTLMYLNCHILWKQRGSHHSLVSWDRPFKTLLHNDEMPTIYSLLFATCFLRRCPRHSKVQYNSIALSRITLGSIDDKALSRITMGSIDDKALSRITLGFIDDKALSRTLLSSHRIMPFSQQFP